MRKKNRAVMDGNTAAAHVAYAFTEVGNAPKMRGKAVFRYEYPNATINFNEKIIIHRGLFGALQIF